MMYKSRIVLYLFFPLTIFINSRCAQSLNKNDNSTTEVSTIADGRQEVCNWCGTSEAPKNTTWDTHIPPEGEPGETLIISGVVYQMDGKTPAKDIIIYVHHTNTEGVYPKTGKEQGNGQYHGYLRGWMKTNMEGRYEFRTIRPAAYHSHTGEPAHIHYNIQEPGYSEYWLTALWFADDTRVTDQYINSVKRQGGFSNIVTLTRDSNNVLRGERNIILERFE